MPRLTEQQEKELAHLPEFVRNRILYEAEREYGDPDLSQVRVCWLEDISQLPEDCPNDVSQIDQKMVFELDCDSAQNRVTSFGRAWFHGTKSGTLRQGDIEAVMLGGSPDTSYTANIITLRHGDAPWLIIQPRKLKEVD